MAELALAYLQQATREDSDHWSGPPELVDRILRHVRTGPYDLVLDVGAGVGGPARRLARLAKCRVIALDILPEVVVRGRRRTAVVQMGGATNVGFVAGSAEELPIASSAIDQVWSLGAAAHFRDRERFATEVTRVLRPGGTLVLTEAFWNGPAPPRFLRSAPEPWHPVRAADLSAALVSGGLDRVEVRPWPGLGIPGSLHTSDPCLTEDLAERRLVPLMVVAERR